jgi:hypothetical protein
MALNRLRKRCAKPPIVALDSRLDRAKGWDMPLPFARMTVSLGARRANREHGLGIGRSSAIVPLFRLLLVSA